jgi:D-tyrosyl-tRNA(Tyr) deacylase
MCFLFTINLLDCKGTLFFEYSEKKMNGVHFKFYKKIVPLRLYKKSMRTVIQRVKQASVSIEGKIYSSIENGLLILLGIETEDNQEDTDWLCGKIARLRIFNDENGVMNLSVCDVKGSCLVVSQFALHASTKKGNRPSYIRAAQPEIAVPLYEKFIKTLADTTQIQIKTGVFGANMQIELTNDGPVTIIVDSKNRE